MMGIMDESGNGRIPNVGELPPGGSEPGSAGDTPFTPMGSIEADNVQDAIEEVAAEGGDITVDVLGTAEGAAAVAGVAYPWLGDGTSRRLDTSIDALSDREVYLGDPRWSVDTTGATAINAALTAAITHLGGVGTIRLPAGTLLIDDFDMASYQVDLVGSIGTYIKPQVSGAGLRYTAFPSQSRLRYLDNIRFLGTGKTDTRCGVYLNCGSGVAFDRCSFQDIQRAVYSNATEWVRYRSCWIRQCGTAITIVRATSADDLYGQNMFFDINPAEHYFEQCNIELNSVGLYFEDIAGSAGGDVLVGVSCSQTQFLSNGVGLAAYRGAIAVEDFRSGWLSCVDCYFEDPVAGTYTLGSHTLGAHLLYTQLPLTLSGPQCLVNSDMEVDGGVLDIRNAIMFSEPVVSNGGTLLIDRSFAYNNGGLALHNAVATNIWPGLSTQPAMWKGAPFGAYVVGSPFVNLFGARGLCIDAGSNGPGPWGSPTMTAITNDGHIDSKSTQFVAVSGHGANFSLSTFTAGWHVVSGWIKVVSGAVQVTGLGGLITSETGWVRWVGLHKLSADPVSLILASGGSATFRLSAWQALRFGSLAEASRFIASNLYIRAA